MPNTIASRFLTIAAPGLVLIASLGGASAAAGTPADIGQALRDLDSPRRADRVAAEQALFEQGPSLFESLPDAADLTAAQNSVLQRVRQRMIRQQTELTRRPSMVQLPDGLSVAEVISKMQDQTGNPITADGLSADVLKSPARIDGTPISFWTAVRRVAEQTNSDVGTDGGTVTLRPRVADAISSVAVAESGPYRIVWVATEFKPLPDKPDRQLVRCRLAFQPEPRLHPLFLTARMADMQLRSTQDDAFTGWNPQAVREFDRTQDRGALVTVDFVGARPLPVGPLTLTGKAEIILSAFEDVIVFPIRYAEQPLQRRRGDLVVTLDSVARPVAERPGNLSLALSVRYAGAVAFESHRQHVLHRGARLRFADGLELKPDRIGWDQTSRTGVAVSYQFVLPEDRRTVMLDAELVYTAPTSFVTLPLEFELTEVTAED